MCRWSARQARRCPQAGQALLQLSPALPQKAAAPRQVLLPAACVCCPASKVAYCAHAALGEAVPGPLQQVHMQQCSAPQCSPISAAWAMSRSRPGPVLKSAHADTDAQPGQPEQPDSPAVSPAVSPALPAGAQQVSAATSPEGLPALAEAASPQGGLSVLTPEQPATESDSALTPCRVVQRQPTQARNPHPDRPDLARDRQSKETCTHQLWPTRPPAQATDTAQESAYRHDHIQLAQYAQGLAASQAAKQRSARHCTAATSPVDAGAAVAQYQIPGYAAT